MPFQKAIFHDNYRDTFQNCGKCGKEFKVGEKIFKRFTGGVTVRHKLKEYLCEECYEALYF